jgi:hypothetical protein
MTTPDEDAVSVINRYRGLASAVDGARREFDAMLGNPEVDAAELEQSAQQLDQLEQEAAGARRRVAELFGDPKKWRTERQLDPNNWQTAQQMLVAVRNPEHSRPGRRVEPDLVIEGPDGRLLTVEVKRQSRRDAIGYALDVLGAPARTANLTDTITVLTGSHLSAGDLVQVRTEERRAWSRAQVPHGAAVPRSWYITPVLDAESLNPMSGTFALSSWPIRDRLFSLVAQRIWAARSLVRLARTLEADPSRAPELQPLIRRFARGTKWGGQVVATTGSGKTEQFLAPLLEAVAGAEAEVDRLMEDHLKMVEKAEEKVMRLTEREPEVELWGLPRARGEAGIRPRSREQAAPPPPPSPPSKPQLRKPRRADF